ncbi:hypothetical protein ACFMBG_01795 [Leisingera sp. D0M16]|uniref:hypothetical protein n=1 Tax=Leisingera coralii TaxID=3351347 RepID=UPI003B77BE63
MKKLTMPGLAVLLVVLAVIGIVNFKSEFREALGTWYKLFDLFLQVFAPLVGVWFMIVAAGIGRNDSKVLPNGDRAIGIRTGALAILTLCTAVFVPLFVYSGFIDPDAARLNWLTILFWGAPSLLFIVATIAAWVTMFSWNETWIRSRSLLGSKTLYWADLQRIDGNGYAGTATLHFAQKRKLEISGFYEAVEELIHFAFDKHEDNLQLAASSAQNATAPVKQGVVNSQVWTRVWLSLLFLAFAAFMSYGAWYLLLGLKSRPAQGDGFWGVALAGAAIYFLWWTWALQGVRYRWSEQVVEYREGVMRKWRKMPWRALKCIEMARDDSAASVLIFKDDVKLRVHGHLVGAEALIAYAESRLNDA